MSTGLVEILQSAEDKRHTLLTWCIENYSKLYSLNNNNDTSKVNVANTILNELDQFICKISLFSEDNAEVYNSHYIFIRISQLYCLSLTIVKNEHPGKIFDSGELLNKILSEENITNYINDSTDNNNNNNNNPTGTSTASTSNKKLKKIYLYTPAKDLACTILIQLHEIYGHDLSSLASLILTTIFKNLKKLMEKSKYNHANFMILLLKLYNSILRNSKNHNSDIFTTFQSKFVKLSKNVFSDIYNDKQDFPVNFISTIIEIWKFNFINDTFIKDYTKGNILDTLYLKFIEHEIGIYGFSNDYSRLLTSKTLSEILFHYYKVKDLVTLDEIWSFYVKVYTNSISRDVKSGCFESIIHFICLCLAIDSNFLSGSNYLQIIRSLSNILNELDSIDYKMDELSRSLRYLNNVNKLLLPRLGDLSKTEILFGIVGTNDSEIAESSDESLSINCSVKNQWLTIVQLELADSLITSLSSSFGTEERIVLKMKEKLLRLATCDIFNIRIRSIKLLKKFFFNFPEYLSDTIEDCLKSLTNDFNLKDNQFIFNKNHGNSLLITNLIEISDKNYVSYELIMKITIFATTFIKKHTTSTHANLYYKGIVCWILLIGLMNYNDDQYLAMQSSQLFLFWKVLLTHSFTYHNEDELYKNLEIRNHALTCLLTFLNKTKVDKDMARQISYLLTKCSNFNHSVTLKSKKLDSVLLMNENRILQIYLKIHDFVKADFNSSLLVLIVKNFSNPNLYTEVSHSIFSSLSGGDKNYRSKNEGKEETIMETTVNNLLRLNDDFAFGLSSKVNGSNVLQSSIKLLKKTSSTSEFNMEWNPNDYYWYSSFENEVLKPISSSLSVDYLVMLYENQDLNTSEFHTSPRVTTSVVDSSMDIFSLVFPYLNNKIQSSIIENLNLSMFSRTITPLRRIAIAANACVAIHNCLSIIQERDLSLDENVGQLLIDSIKKIEFYNDSYITQLKADCIGLTIAAMVRNSPEELKRDIIKRQSHILINNVVEVDEPHFRVFHALSLASIFKYNPKFTSFETILEVIISLVKDPHPVVHSWSLKALHILLEKHLVIDISTTAKLLGILESVLTNPSFGIYGSSILRYNYNKQYDSHIVISQIIKTLTETVGPNIPELPKSSIESFKNLTISGLLSSNIVCQMLSTKIYENIATFKLAGIMNDTLFIRCSIRTIVDVINIGIGSNYFNSNFTLSHEIISHTASLKGAFECFKLFGQLFKLQKKQLFVKDMDSLSWIYLTLYPDSPCVMQYFVEWIDYSVEDDQYWFDKLYMLFNMPRSKIFDKYNKTISQLFKSKEYNSIQEAKIKGEEELSINDNIGDISEHKEADKAQWQTKQVILILIKHSLELSYKNKKILNTLSKHVPELIRMVCQASAMRIRTIKSLGLDILKYILDIFSKVKDTEIPENSILSQQEAQIISALMPTFNKGTSPDIVASAINVAAEFLASGVAPLNRLGRISRLLIELLTSFDERSSSIVVGESVIITQKAKRKIELSLLNAWAGMVQTSLHSDNEELITFTQGYWSTLIPLWIISLREYVMVKYGNTNINGMNSNDTLLESKKTKLELYEDVWLNFVEVLGSLLDYDQNLILKCLNKEEIESFMFILFSQCLEAIVINFDNHDVKCRVLPAIHNVLNCKVPLTLLFDNDVYPELINILDRIILTGESDEKLIVVNIINDLISGYIIQNSSQELFLQGIDKLYELLRLLMNVISELIPFIKYNAVVEPGSGKKAFTKVDTELLKSAFAVFELNVNKFDDVFKEDLYSCLLFIIGRIYEVDNRNDIVPLILPLLKSIIYNILQNGTHVTLLDVFYDSTKSVIFNELSKENKIATILILLTTGYSGFSRKELDYTSELLLSAVNDPNTSIVAERGLQRIFNNSLDMPSCSVICLNVIKKCAEDFDQEVSTEQANLRLNLISTFTKNIFAKDKSKFQSVLALYLSFVIWFSELSTTENKTVANIIVELVQLDPDCFKNVVNNVITSKQKVKIEQIVEEATLESSKVRDNENASVALKNFN
ncbi:hypothetical protein Kpol_2000p20 [Vanderwaltozyma polyspora DSM 70294]|uniref:LAA1-like C-terminal TPR repeats domain-containing protein n=1 Tax=Vanderwaltozyma polyspora (strain ATCC 22028 / DSM 70294 / BCRC 21397 / CBS 2163 / NBRC 10782 / NRRL Y-8283 / UCD 57-17) TaxID=436907 RepID=A7TF31_VANPO|nr:uncharacterized protein Kpol_2000p20 [Vanderwaltozyma polyspora DSM 70294]EDO19056.1 hypothetical protein Kpol_2000p20 [Vanderwaltozyma polyspora DSM 70294]